MKKLRSILCVLLAVLLMVGACAVAEAKPASYKIVHLAPLTGDASFQGQILVNAAQMAVDEINAAGGINGVPIEYVPIDETSSTNSGIEAVRKAISENPDAIIGPNRSGTILAAHQLWQEAGIPAITDGTNAATTKQNNPYTFRIQIPSTFWIPILAKTAKEYYNASKIAVIYGNNEYSQGLWDATTPALEEYGLETVAVLNYNDGDRDFTSQLLEVRKSGADALFLYGYEAELGLIVRQRTELGMGDLPVFGERGCASPAVQAIAGDENFNGMVCSTTLSQGDPAESIQAFIKKYGETFDTALSPTHVNHYDSIKILADVIGRVGNDHDAIRDALAVLDFEGALGHYQADSEGNLVHTIHTQVFKDGAWQLLLTEEYPVE
ncbi:MAG: Leucine-, isoleucine-, valine-, threonine-, and alanine-binding protein precursor [Firmicutes bacterium ADurb.Bin467]|nr:MAG: Leucine-, isoleucine-, valine-, threonine-, and alanine-binding protein precursor [Firmicutes bacterium ADurb.Bin467]